jgi:hypothetical protein
MTWKYQNKLSIIPQEERENSHPNDGKLKPNGKISYALRYI